MNNPKFHDDHRSLIDCVSVPGSMNTPACGQFSARFQNKSPITKDPRPIVAMLLREDPTPRAAVARVPAF